MRAPVCASLPEPVFDHFRTRETVSRSVKPFHKTRTDVLEQKFGQKRSRAARQKLNLNLIKVRVCAPAAS